MKKVSIIIPLYNEQQCVESLCTSLRSLAARIENHGSYEVEFLFVDDGSTDETWLRLMTFAEGDARFRLASLSRNFGQQVALSCGYRLAGGDAVVSMDADLQDPPEVVLEMLVRWERGADIVYAVREKREAETWLKKTTAAFFYRLYQAISSSRAPLDAGDFRLMGRCAVNALNQFNERHRYLRGMVGCLGFKTEIVKYVRQPRTAGHTKFSMIKMLIFSADAIVSSSTVPLRMIYVCGIVCAMPFSAYLIYALVAHYAFNVPLDSGWLSVILCSIFFGLFNLICMGIMGEYIGRLYEEAKNRPLFLIRETYPHE